MTRRGGSWILGLLVVGAMAGGGWFVLRGKFNRELVTVVLLQSTSDRGPTGQAFLRGARFALDEKGQRAGKFRVSLHERQPASVYSSPDTVVAWIGTSEALLAMGHQLNRPFCVSILDTYPLDPEWVYRISANPATQGENAARWARKSGASRVALLRDPTSPRSSAISAAFVRAAAAQGTAVEGPIEATLGNLDRVVASKPDLVFYSGEEAPYGTAAKLFAALRERGFTGKLVTGEADPEVSFLATRSGPLDGTYLVSPFAPAPGELASRMEFTPGPHVTAGYFAMKAVLDTIDRANSVEEDLLHRAARAVPAPRPCALYVAKNGVFEFVELLD